MIKRRQRVVVLELRSQGQGIRAIARLTGLSRRTVREILASGHENSPEIERPSQLEPHRAQIEDLMTGCKGNRIRVHEELEAAEIRVSYPALTAFCRANGIGVVEKGVSGIYHFDPGQEMQHDTSPHRVVIAGQARTVQTAATVLAFSRVVFAQMFPRFRRFECRIHLTESLRYFDGSPSRTVIDNTSVVVGTGSGSEMTPAPEMAAFADRFGFQFIAHAIGHSDRKGRIESQVGYVEKNFIAGRTFASWQDLNNQLRDWCDRVNQKPKRVIGGVPNELLDQEKRRLKPLPDWIPEPYLVHQRTVDSQGFVHLDGNRYSVPEDWVDRPVQIRETCTRIEIDLDRNRSVVHEKEIERRNCRFTLPEHRRPRRRRENVATVDQVEIVRRLPQIAGYVTDLRKRSRNHRAIRRLRSLVRDYPAVAIVAAVTEAHRYGLFDIDRLETMILRRIHNDYFHLDGDER